MKKTHTLALLITLVLFLLASYYEPRYERTDCEVVAVEGCVVEVEDGCGYLWSYYVEDEAPSVGDVVTLKMHTNNTTDYIDDDVVLDVVAQ